MCPTQESNPGPPAYHADALTKWVSRADTRGRHTYIGPASSVIPLSRNDIKLTSSVKFTAIVQKSNPILVVFYDTHLDTGDLFFSTPGPHREIHFPKAKGNLRFNCSKAHVHVHRTTFRGLKLQQCFIVDLARTHRATYYVNPLYGDKTFLSFYTPFKEGGTYCSAHVGRYVGRLMCRSPLTLCNQ